MNTPDPTFQPLPPGGGSNLSRVLGATASGTGCRLNLVSEIGTEYSHTITAGVTAVTVDSTKQDTQWTPDGLARWAEALIKHGVRIDVKLVWDEQDISQRRILSAAFTTTTGGR